VFANVTSVQPDPAALERVEELVRARYRIGADQIVLVSQEPGRAPGLPDHVTTILFWDGPGTRHRLRVFRPVADIAMSDLPAAWLRGTLRDEGGDDCC